MTGAEEQNQTNFFFENFKHQNKKILYIIFLCGQNEWDFDPQIPSVTDRK